MSFFHKKLTKLWLRKFTKQTMIPSVRSVVLGDVVSNNIILDGIYEKFEIEALKDYVFSHLNKNSNCLDIGANIGNHSCTFANFFAKVYAFEPNPPIRYVLQANTYGKNIEVIDCGLSNSEGTAFFKQNFTNLGASRIVKTTCDSDFLINIKTLDNIVKERDIKDVSFVKIDVEGHEAEVLQGGEYFFTEQKPIIALEAFFLSHPEKAEEVLSTLQSFGYGNFYTLNVKSNFFRVLPRLLGLKITKVIALLLPTTISKSLIISKVINPLLTDHQLLICTQKNIKFHIINKC
jgi:FkbM family methyltransferase